MADPKIWLGNADYLLSQQQENDIDRRFTETVDTLEIVQADNHAIERIIFGVDSVNS